MLSAMASGRAIGMVLVVLASLAAVAALLLLRWVDGNRHIALARVGWQDDAGSAWKTEYEPLTASGRDSVRKVRSVGLWELPAECSAQARGERKSVRAVGDDLVDGHTELDRRAVECGRALKVAHGQVFSLVGLVRDQIRNVMVRWLAIRANAVVLDHITVPGRYGACLVSRR
jgi:hypothetical protein